MTLTLRPYQREATERVIEHFRAESSSACIVLPTGSGKSLVIADLCQKAQGRVLAVAHVKELCRQNFEKYVDLVGPSSHRPAGIFSAGLGQKESERPVTFGSIQSIAKNLDAFEEPISLLIIDECHRVSTGESSEYARLLTFLRKKNPNLKVLGLTATPYRLGLGWCYREHFRGFFRTDGERPFEKCVYELSLKSLIDQGYLTRPAVSDAPIAQYNFHALLEYGEPTPEALSDLLASKGRVTQAITAQIVHLAEEQNRRGVMIFAATVKHAQEILGYLPEGEAALIVGATESEERDALTRAFTNKSVRYLVNVSVLTTGFDAPHVDLIAILRATESVGLYQQIVGRGLRLFPGKSDCLVMDYAGNGHELFSPEIGERKPSADSVIVPVTCPNCEFVNQFWGKQDSEGHIFEHYGRRCQARVVGDDGVMTRCSFRFRFKECERCGGENDIAARRCEHCEETLVDPDDQLRRALSLKEARVLRVQGITLSAEGSRLFITYHDEDGSTEREQFDFSSAAQRGAFNRIFGRRIAQGRRPLVLETPDQACRLAAHLPAPDFVVFRRHGKGRAAHFRLSARLFDYQGRYRTADR